jgi:hypothetical protein
MRWQLISVSMRAVNARREALPCWICLFIITAVITGQSAFAADEPWEPVRTVIYDWSEARSVEHPDLVRIDEDGVLNAGSMQDACNAAMDRMLEAAREQPDARVVTDHMVIRTPVELRRGSEVRTVACPGLVLTRTERFVPRIPELAEVDLPLRAPAEALLRAEDDLCESLLALGDPICNEFSAAFKQISPVPVWPALYNGEGPDDPLWLAEVLWRGYQICRVQYDSEGPSVSITLVVSPAASWNIQRVSDWFYVARRGRDGPQVRAVTDHSICPTQGIEIGVVIDDPAIVLRAFGAAPITPSREKPVWDLLNEKSPAARDLAVRRAVDHLLSLVGDEAAPWVEGRRVEWLRIPTRASSEPCRLGPANPMRTEVIMAIRQEFMKPLDASYLKVILVTVWMPEESPVDHPLTWRQIYIRYRGSGWDDRGGLSHAIWGASLGADTTVGAMKYILVDPNKIRDSEQELWEEVAARMVEIVQRGPDVAAKND